MVEGPFVNAKYAAVYDDEMSAQSLSLESQARGPRKPRSVGSRVKGTGFRV